MRAVPDNLLYGCTPIGPSAAAGIKHDNTSGLIFRLKAEATPLEGVASGFSRKAASGVDAVSSTGPSLVGSMRHLFQ